ncbi:MAG TPA: ecotin family protein [Humisphaera sp.]
MRLALALSAFAVLLVTSAASAADETSEAAGYLKKAYPPAEAGMVRYAILLPKRDREDDVKVELIVGKKTTVDSANGAAYGGQIETVNIEGWGFTRYVVKDLGGVMQTLRGGGHPEERFVKVQSILVRYNSRVPIAVYVPEGAEVQYRLWTATPEATPMTKG